jgi:hypothetical protein
MTETQVKELRTYLLCDDHARNLYVARRTEDQVKVDSPLHSLEIGDIFTPDPEKPHLYWMRET